ncbi:hypothetical protein FRC03_001331 [Tulasnella sp. 419]|nr:hypothetical protein FRC03_001331 [Tulasnella sp. 419]
MDLIFSAPQKTGPRPSGDISSLRVHWKAKVSAPSMHTTQRSDMIASFMEMWDKRHVSDVDDEWQNH